MMLSVSFSHNLAITESLANELPPVIGCDADG